MAISVLYNNQPVRLFEADGDFASGAKAYFYLARTTTPMSVYTDAPLAVPHTWPVIADAYGLLAPIYITSGHEYKVRIEDALGNILYAADGIANPAEPDAGGGGGIVVTAAQVAQTGDMIWNASGADRLGWVRANGRTISATAGSGDTKNDDCQALFAYLWNNFSDTLCPVTPGPRTNATADWQAGKAIATLDMRGIAMFGLDDMGSSNAGRLTISGRNLTTTIGSPTATIDNAGLLARNQVIVCANLPASTSIVSLNGPTVTLNKNATASGTVACTIHFSGPSSTTPGGGGGVASFHQSVNELVPHSHAIAAVNITAGTNVAAGANYTVSSVSTTNSTGDGAAMYIMPLHRVGSYWLKK
jgi:hypothetical protein